MKMPEAYTEISSEEMMYDDGGFSLGSILSVVGVVGGIIAGVATLGLGFGAAAALGAVMIGQTVGTTAGSIADSVQSDGDEPELPVKAPTVGF